MEQEPVARFKHQGFKGFIYKKCNGYFVVWANIGCHHTACRGVLKEKVDQAIAEL